MIEEDAEETVNAAAAVNQTPFIVKRSTTVTVTFNLFMLRHEICC